LSPGATPFDAPADNEVAVAAAPAAGVCSGSAEYVARGLGGVHVVWPPAAGLTTCLMLRSSCSSCSSLLRRRRVSEGTNELRLRKVPSLRDSFVRFVDDA